MMLQQGQPLLEIDLLCRQLLDVAVRKQLLVKRCW
jgi:hypothetical protein